MDKRKKEKEKWPYGCTIGKKLSTLYSGNYPENKWQRITKRKIYYRKLTQINEIENGA